MIGFLQGPVRRWWAGGGGPGGALLRVLTAPIEGLYRRVVSWRNRVYDRRGGARVAGLKVVSVGNLSVGGTGKTPIAAWVARLLLDAGAKPALVARGYGRDELLLHRRWTPAVPVIADPDRVAAAGRARAQGADVVVLDDGFQHRRLARDIDIVLLAAGDPYPGRMLPRGPFREAPAALARADAVIVTRRTAMPQRAEEIVRRVSAAHPHITVGLVSLMPGGWQELDGTPAVAPLGRVLCVAAIARPEAFALQVGKITGFQAELWAFPDHHDFSAADARAIQVRAGERPVVVTEKDAVKLQEHEALLGTVRVMVQALRWESGEDRVSKLVTSVLTKEA